MDELSSTDIFSLNGKTILVTGASSGIGAATAALCSRLGAKLVINGRDEDRLNSTYHSLEGEGHIAVAGDLTDTKTHDALLGAAEKYNGLVSSAGIAALVPFRMATEQHLQKLLSVNYMAPMTLVQRLLYKRKLQEGSSLVFISALAARAAPQAAAGYAASKAALEAAVRTLALEHAKQRIRANCIVPSYVDTPMLEKLVSTADMDGRTKSTPLGNITADDIAKGAIYLLSEASRWVTRSTLTIDGGVSLPIRL